MSAAARLPKLLVIDDDPFFRHLATRLLSSRFEIVCAVDGERGLERFADWQPDVAIIDLGLPGLDGFEVTRRIKTERGGHLVPIIVTTSASDPEHLARALAVGADDVLCKPLDGVLATRKIDAALRTREHFRRLEGERAELVRYQRRTEQDHRTAQSIVTTLLQRGCLEESFIRAVLSPLSIFNGDFVLAARLRDGRLRGMLGDFAGHGLTAAIGTMPVADIFYGASANGAPLGLLLHQLNAKLRATMPRDLFCAATLFEIDGAAGTLTVWNGGMPALWLRRADGRLEELVSRQLPLGVLDEAAFDETTQTVAIGSGDRLLGCTDGLTEQSNDGGEMFGTERVREVYRAADADLDTLLGAVAQFRNGRSAADDVTLVEVQVGPELLAPSAATSTGRAANEGRGVRLSIELGADMIASGGDFVGLVHGALVHGLPQLSEHAGTLFTVVAELVNNAVDYGVLKLDARMKDAPDGFAAYYAARQRALERVTHGWIRVEATVQRADGERALILRVVDSGNGIVPSSLARPGERRGRGMKLLSELCRELRKLPAGRGFEITYALGPG